MIDSRIFKSPEELHLTVRQHNAILVLLNMMERGDIKPLPGQRELLNCFPKRGGKVDYFDYRTVGSLWDCGTSGCILGWLLYLDKDAFWNEEEGFTLPDQLDALCFSNFPWFQNNGDRDEVSLAAIAIRHYLLTGKGVVHTPV